MAFLLVFCFAAVFDQSFLMVLKFFLKKSNSVYFWPVTVLHNNFIKIVRGNFGKYLLYVFTYAPGGLKKLNKNTPVAADLRTQRISNSF
jgi:hypothetical protein